MKELQASLPSEIPIVIAGNKSDMRLGKINKDALDKYVRSVGAIHFMTSAKLGTNVSEIFSTLAESNLLFSLV